MGDHWPLIVASGLIALAAALGLWQHDRAVEITAQIPTPIRTVSEPAPVAPATAEKPEAVQTPPPLPAANRTAFAPMPALVTEPALVAPAPVAVAPAVAVAPTAPSVVAPAPTVPAVLPTAPTAPAVVPNGAPPVRQGRNATLAALRTDLQAQMNIAPMDTAGG